ncbi:hypothetical protein MBANPS3_010336 [Mucor bainieri]
MRKRQRDEQGVGAPDGQLKKQRASEESPSPSPSPSTGSQKIASSGSANESSSSAGQSMQVDPAQAPPRRGLHGRNWDLLSTCGLLGTIRTVSRCCILLCRLEHSSLLRFIPF